MDEHWMLIVAMATDSFVWLALGLLCVSKPSKDSRHLAFTNVSLIVLRLNLFGCHGDQRRWDVFLAVAMDTASEMQHLCTLMSLIRLSLCKSEA